ncbi:NADH dehydrogenase [ubiquinone] 1 beta subcomplex subunit 9 [Corapipo altera]|uniref:NADH dehydrogenase [ubiquinone] 1 beta subcomplex subunit 9 n=1 Tax=Corapipo altera TaxID=415028 RepID=UPI000FD6A170|nr:NADH dehydrogenase [ubiquinone] 1 beta subcomplex subunit 9 [Corapipo altera]
MAAYLTHQQKVLRLYKKSLRHLESWCIYRDKYRYFACLLRERFDKNKDVKDMVKATQLLRAGEEEFWANQHPQPYIFPDSPGGTSYERYECYKIKQLEEETPADGPKTEALPPARKEGHLPPLWWQYVTRPREIPM